MSLASRLTVKTAKKKAAKAAAKTAPKVEKPLAAKPTGGKPAATAPAKPKTEKPLAVPGKRNAPASGTKKPAVDFSEGFGTFKSGPTKVIWEDNKDGTIEVVSLRTPSAKRGQGAGRTAMQDFLAEADRQGLDVKLGASPLDKRTKLNKLVDFYKSLGFETTGKSINMAGEPEMIRRARPTAPGGKSSKQKIAAVPASQELPIATDPQGIIAYHGSPHSFDRFDISKIGTGEGAQAYGHGLYFAEAEDTARNYRNALARPEPGDMVGNAYDLVRILGEKDALENLKGINSKEAIATADAIISGAYKQYKPPGSMYQVRIKADPNQLLNWDQPIIAQSPEVQQAALLAAQNADISHLGSGHRARVKLERFMDAAEQAHDPLKGSELMMAVDRGPGNNFTPETSELLRAYGIPGVKYLDQASRTAGEGTRNYVVFDDALIDLLRRYAKGGIV